VGAPGRRVAGFDRCLTCLSGRRLSSATSAAHRPAHPTPTRPPGPTPGEPRRAVCERDGHRGHPQALQVSGCFVAPHRRRAAPCRRSRRACSALRARARARAPAPAGAHAPPSTAHMRAHANTAPARLPPLTPPPPHPPRYVFHNLGTKLPFPKLVMEVMRRLEGAYALVFKSRHYPGEMVACRRGSPLIVGVKLPQVGTLGGDGPGGRALRWEWQGPGNLLQSLCACLISSARPARPHSATPGPGAAYQLPLAGRHHQRQLPRQGDRGLGRERRERRHRAHQEVGGAGGTWGRPGGAGWCGPRPLMPPGLDGAAGWGMAVAAIGSSSCDCTEYKRAAAPPRPPGSSCWRTTTCCTWPAAATESTPPRSVAATRRCRARCRRCRLRWTRS
jgi:hypothetical protein